MTTKKKERSQFTPLNAADKKKLAALLPPGVPTLGLRWDEVDDYITSFQRFRRQILNGNFRPTRLAWKAVAKYKNTLLVNEVAAVEAVDDYDKKEAATFVKTGVNPFTSDDWFVIHEAFIISAFAIGVFRHGFSFEEDVDDYTDEALQYAHYGFINQG